MLAGQSRKPLNNCSWQPDFVSVDAASHRLVQTIPSKIPNGMAVKGGEKLGQVVSMVSENVRLSGQRKCHSYCSR